MIDPAVDNAIRCAVRAVEARARQRHHFADEFERVRIVAECAADFVVDHIEAHLRDRLPGRHILVHLARVIIDTNSN